MTLANERAFNEHRQPPASVQVLIVGGGPVGLSAAIELGRQGVSCLILEPRTSISHLKPRAKTTSVRTMEYFRRWGITERIREVAPLKVAWSQEVVFCTSLLGHEVTRFHDCFGLSPQPADLSPESGQQIAQPLIEEVLREAVSELPSCHLALGWTLQAIEQDEHRISAIILNADGEQRQIVSDYALGCDGARSVVRAAMGARYEGQSDPRPNLGIVFRAPGLFEQQPHGPAVQYWVLKPGSSGLMGRMDMQDRWWAIVNGVHVNADPLELIAGLVGGEVKAQVLATDPWTARMLLVDRYRNRRMFLLGDAAHLNPPWGGHGFNTGIGDAVNLGWKLAARLNGWGGDTLLESYEVERRPIAEQTILEASANMKVLAPELSNLEMAGDDLAGLQARQAAAKTIQVSKDREFHSLTLVLGYSYISSPVIVNDRIAPAAPDPEQREYQPTANPGARLPHVWMSDGRSLYDQLGEGLSLLRFDGHADVASFLEAANNAGIPLRVIELHELLPESQRLERYGEPLVLVRPDQHVAWRGAAVNYATARAILHQVCGLTPRI